ncbi:MAG: cell division protein FtsX [Hyphomicrobiaceae bacterium]
MSGSYNDESTGRSLPKLEYDPFGGIDATMDSVNGAAKTHVAGQLKADRPSHVPESHADAQDTETGKEQTNAPIVEAGSVTGKSLTLVIAIMCFLACLTAGAVYLINQAANAWLRDIATEVTVQVEPAESIEATERLVKDVTAFLIRQPGVDDVRILSDSQSAELLEPWLGTSVELSALQLPRLIAIELSPEPDLQLEKLRSGLQAQFQSRALLDDHRQWQVQIKTVTRSFALGGSAILLLVGAATTAIIVSATRSAMASNREIVEVLHFVGATDRFIAREFEKHFLNLGIRAGVVGATSAMLVFFLMPTLMEFLGGESITVAEFRRLVGTGALDAPGYVLLALVVVVIAALCMLTSRFGVFRILHSQN